MSEMTAIEELRRRGFTVDFQVVGEVLRALGSGQVFRADDVTIQGHRRFEGVSDPDDMSVIYALEAADGTRGLLVDAFGVYANPTLGAFLDGVQVRRDRTLSPAAA